MGIVNFSPKQDGTGDPSPTNVRPIHPGLVLKSKNLLSHDDWTVGKTYQYVKFIDIAQECIMSFTIKDSSIDVSDLYIGFAINEATSAATLNNGYRWCMEKGSIKNVKVNTVYYPSATAGQLCSYCVVYPPTQDAFDRLFAAYNIQIELGSTPTEYEPYYNMDIYGGYVDFDNAELVESWGFKHLIGSDFQSISNGRQGNAPYMPYTYRITDAKALTSSEYGYSVVSDKIATKTGGSWANEYEGYMNDTQRFLFGGSEDFSAISYVRSWVDEIGGIDIVYRLDSPTTYNLSESQLTQAYNQLVPVSPVMLSNRRRILLNTPHLETVSGAVANFKANMSAPLRESKINFAPKQSGTGTPSPTNVMPISGWDGVTVNRVGKNLFDANNVIRRDGYLIIDDGTESTTDVSGYTQSLTPVFPRVTYTFRGTTAIEGTWRIYFYYADQTFRSRTTSIPYNYGSYTFTVPDNCYYVAFQYHANAVDFSTFQLEVGSTSTDFEPHITPLTIPISWQSLAGTLYGGYVDLTNGELVQTMGYAHIDETYDWRSSSATSHSPYRYYILSFQPSNGKYEPVVSDKFAPYGAWDPWPFYAVLNNGGHLTIGAPEELPTVADFKAWLQEVGGVDVAYPLVNSVTYQLTPQQIKTLKGINNIWSDTNGDVEVKYWKH